MHSNLCKQKKTNKTKFRELICTILESYPMYKVSVIPYPLFVRAVYGSLKIYTGSKIKLWTISTKQGCQAINLLTDSYLHFEAAQEPT